MKWNFNDNRPIYSQIVEQMTLFIASGQLKAGERIMPVRELASEIGVNPNTLQRALSELERSGLVLTNRTAGRFVTEDTVAIENCRRAIFESSAEAFLQSMRRLGYSRDEAAELIRTYKGASENE